MTYWDSETFASSTVASKRSSAAIPLVILFLICGLTGWGVGIAQASKEVDSRWRISGYTDWTMSADFQTMTDSSDSCSGTSPYGCGIYHVVSKNDCSQVSGTLSFEDASGKTYEYVDATSEDITWGKPFILQFDATAKGKGSSKINLISLKCTK